MAITFTRFSQWMLRGDQKPRRSRKKSPPPSTDFPSGFRESEPVKLNFNFSNHTPTSSSPSSSPASRRLRKRRGSSRDKKIDKEHDMVIVPSDGGGCISGSESDGSDWSIGWLEPHPHDFCTSDGESEDSFAVLVPCYRHALANPSLERVNAGFSFGVRMPTPEDLPESNEFLQQWLSSLTSDPLV